MSRSNRGIIRTVRDIMPARPVTLGEAYILAERQAVLLLKLLGIKKLPVDINRLADLPKISIDVQPRHEMPNVARVGPISEIAGVSHRWRNGQWHITINENDCLGRRRFSLGHEFKHVLDYTIYRLAYSQLGYGDYQRRLWQIERICDHFAASFLMPRVAMKRAWAHGIQDVEALADLFCTSLTAMRIRLDYLGLTNKPKRPIGDYFTRKASDFDLDQGFDFDLGLGLDAIAA
jgi:hypothetical protein